MQWLTVALIASASGAEFRSGTDVVVASDEVIDDDLYVAGRTVRVEGSVTGDVLAAAEHITVTGEVGGDLMAAGRTVRIEGRVLDDARIAGETLWLTQGSAITSDLLAAGFGLDVQDEASIGEDLNFAGYQLLLDGTVEQDAFLWVTAARITGDVAGNMDVELNHASSDRVAVDFDAPMSMSRLRPGLEITKEATIGGDLAYRSPEVGSVDGAVTGKTRHEPVPYTQHDDPTDTTVFNAVRRFLALLVVGLGLVAAFPARSRTVAEEVRQRPLRSLGVGAATAIAFVAAGLLIAAVTLSGTVMLGLVTLGGLAGAVFLLGMLAEGTLITTLVVVAGWIAPLPVIFALGTGLVQPFSKDRTPGRGWLLLAGLVPYVLVTMVPYLGGAVGFLVTLTGLGALAWTAGQTLRSRK